MCVKHLNPRQGITALIAPRRAAEECTVCVKHLNPRQGITAEGSAR